MNSLASKWYHSNTVMAIRKVTVGENHCAIFCKGPNCKYEDPNFWRPDQMVLNGSFSHWVTNDVMAMSRPTTQLIQEYDFIGQLKAHCISSIFCVQKPGEHSRCGRKLELSGFSYDPQVVMDSGIYFYNFGWDDFGVPSMPMLLDMVRVVDFAISRGKVAIHCHAGLGRTGVLIACYLVYSRRWDGSRAITLVRAKRPGALQTVKQVELVMEYKSYMDCLWKVFSVAEEDRFTLDECILNQSQLLHGNDWKENKYVPRVVKYLCELLMKDTSNLTIISSKRNVKKTEINEKNLLSNSLEFNIKELQLIKSEFNSTLDWGVISGLEGITILGLLLDWVFSLKNAVLTHFEIFSIKRILSETEELPWGGVRNENSFNLLDFFTYFLSTVKDNCERENLIFDISRVLVVNRNSIQSSPIATPSHSRMRSILPLCSGNNDINAFTPQSMPQTDHLPDEIKTQIIADGFIRYLTFMN